MSCANQYGKLSEEMFLRKNVLCIYREIKKISCIKTVIDSVRKS